MLGLLAVGEIPSTRSAGQFLVNRADLMRYMDDARLRTEPAEQSTKEISMSNTHSVWAANTSPEWMARNSGNPRMVLGQADHYNANFMANRLRLLVPGLEVAVRDEHGNFVPIIPEEDAYYELIEKPRKQACGLLPKD